MKKSLAATVSLLIALAASHISMAAGSDTSFITTVTHQGKDTLEQGTLKLPAGFTSAIIASGLQGARHLAVTHAGGVYVKLGGLKNGKGIVYLSRQGADGAYAQSSFGNFPGTGIYLAKGYLYASSNDEVFRYQLNASEEIADTGKAEKIVTGLVNRNRDNSKTIVVDDHANLYVNVGSYVNACLEGTSLTAATPCPLLDSAGGIWQFKAGKTKQTYHDGTRYATGLKNVVGMNWNTQTKSLFVMQHGRDQFHELYPQLYTAAQANLLPAETMYELHKGADAGWPYVYYDQFQHAKILAPEYGGDGKKTGGDKALNPAIAFPAHLAPNDLLFYTGTSFPQKYRNGAFVAFHGKSPELQKGYFIAFVPFKNGKPSGEWEVFADDFGGAGNAVQHKPCGLAQGPDGALYVADDAGGNIYRIQYGK